MSEQSKRTLETKKVQVNLKFPDDLESKFVNQVVVQNHPEYFTLSLFEIVLPPILGVTEEEKKSNFDKIKSVDSKCLGRYIITPNKLKEVIEILQDNLNKYNEMIESENK